MDSAGTEQPALSRRAFCMTASAAVGLLLAAPGAMAAQRVQWRDAMQVLIGNTVPITGRVDIDLPRFVEGGAAVPFTVRVDSEMSEREFVRSVHVLATDNPRPDVASFFFSPQSGRAQASSRVRLWGSQELVAIAEMSSGEVYLGRRPVSITPTVFPQRSGEPDTRQPVSAGSDQAQ